MQKRLALRKQEIEGIIQEAHKKAGEHLPERKSSHKLISRVDERFYTELGEINDFLLKARDSLDDLLNLREQPHIIDKNGRTLDPGLYGREEQLVIDAVYNSLMTLGIRSEADSEGSHQLDISKSKSQKVRAHFILGEVYTALGVNIPQAKKEYMEVIRYGEPVFKEISKDSIHSKGKGLIVPMMRLAYKVGTAYKRLLDIEYHVLETATKTMQCETYEDAEGLPSDKPSVVIKDVPYGYTPNSDGSRISWNPNYRKAREWLWNLFDFNQRQRLEHPDQMDFSYYEFMRYREDIAELGIGCVFNVLGKKKMECITTLDDGYDSSTCPNKLIPNDVRDNIKARAQLQFSNFKMRS